MKTLVRCLFHGSGEDVSQSPPFLLELRSSRWFIILVVSIAIFTDVFLYGVIIPVVPFALTTRAHVSPDSVQRWVAILLAVYSAGLLLASPVMGWLSDRLHTRRTLLLVGLVILSGATIMLCVGDSIGVLIAGRLLQGLSAAVVWTTGLALLVDTVGEQAIGHTMGISSLAYSAGILTGPLLGGVVYSNSGYYAVFYLAFGVIAVDVVLRLAFIEKKVAARWLASAQVASTHEMPVVSPRNASRVGPHADVDVEAGGVSVATQPRETESMRSRHRAPVVVLISSRRLLVAFWGCLVVAALMTAFDSTLPLYANQVFGFDSMGSGLLFLALLLPNCAGPIVGRLSDRYGPRWLATIGFVGSFPFWILLRLVTHKTVPQIVLLCFLLVSIGTGVSLVLSPLMAEFTYIVEAKKRQRPGIFGSTGVYAQSYGLFNTAWASGSIVGPIWAGFVQQRAGWGTMTWTFGVLSALSAVPVVIWTGGIIGRNHVRFGE